LGEVSESVAAGRCEAPEWQTCWRYVDVAEGTIDALL